MYKQPAFAINIYYQKMLNIEIIEIISHCTEK